MLIVELAACHSRSLKRPEEDVGMMQSFRLWPLVSSSCQELYKRLHLAMEHAEKACTQFEELVCTVAFCCFSRKHLPKH